MSAQECFPSRFIFSFWCEGRHISIQICQWWVQSWDTLGIKEIALLLTALRKLKVRKAFRLVHQKTIYLVKDIATQIQLHLVLCSNFFSSHEVSCRVTGCLGWTFKSLSLSVSRFVGSAFICVKLDLFSF